MDKINYQNMFPVSVYEAYVKLYEKMNELINQSNELVTDVETKIEIMKQILDEGLEGIKPQIINQLYKLINNGTIEKIINTNIFNDLNSQIKEKASKNEARMKSVNITLNDCDSNMLNAIKGGEGTSFELESIPRDSSVESSKLTAQFKRALLLDDYSTITFEQGSLSGSDGKEISSTTRIRTDYLQFSQDIKITVGTGYQFKCMVYDNNKNFLYGVNNNSWKGSGTYDVAVDTDYYYRILVAHIGDTEITPSNDEGATISGVLNMADLEIKKVKTDIAKIQDNLSDVKFYGNLIDFLNISFEQGTISGGKPYDSTNRIRTDFLQFSHTVKININSGFRCKYFIYDEDKKFIEVGNNNEWIYNVEEYEIIPNPLYYYRIIVAYTTDAEITVNTQCITIEGLSNQNTIEIAKLKALQSNDSTNINKSNNYVFDFKLQSDYSANSYCSDICVIKDKLFHFATSDDDNVNHVNSFIYDIDLDNKTGTYEKTFKHNLGHVNSVSYNDKIDALIFGNGSGTFDLKGKFFVYPNFYKKYKAGTTIFNISECIEYDCSGIDLGNEYKFNAVWGDDNFNNNDMVLLITNNHRTIHSIQLGKGTNDLGNGVLNSSTGTNEFNGTFKIQKAYTQDTYGATDRDNTYCVQGGQYFGGHLYTGVGHDNIEWWDITFNRDNTVNRKENIKYMYNNTGDKLKTNLGGLSITDKYILLCVNNWIRVYLK